MKRRKIEMDETLQIWEQLEFLKEVYNIQVTTKLLQHIVNLDYRRYNNK